MNCIPSLLNLYTNLKEKVFLGLPSHRHLNGTDTGPSAQPVEEELGVDRLA